jgi:quinol monooxygenase YgiN
MRFKSVLATAVVGLALLSSGACLADPVKSEVVVRIAELEIDPAQLEAYTKAVKEEMAESIRVEPGVLAIYSVAIKDRPTSLRFFEIYANDAAYQAHIASPHFKKYVAITQPMITSRTLMETVPVQLNAQPR